MPCIAYVNGRYGPVERMGVAVEDRGLQFGDSVYEVVAFLNGRFLDWEPHFWRLHNSLATIFIAEPMGSAAMRQIARQLVRKSRYPDGIIYIQISRGAAPRQHGFPSGIRPTVIMTVRRTDYRRRHAMVESGVTAITLPDQRRVRHDIKSTSLLPSVLAKQEASEAGAYDAILIRHGQVAEGASSNIYMVDHAGSIVTAPLSSSILPGIARQALLDEARAAGLDVVERPIPQAELSSASELFLTSTTAPIVPIIRLDDKPVGDGSPGPTVRALAALMWQRILRQTGWQP